MATLHQDTTLDFLVAGLGFGALLVIAGFAVREVGVFLFAPTRTRKQFPDKPELGDAWRRLIRSISNTAMAGGGAMWLAAIAAAAIDLSDRAGALAMAAAATVVSLAGAGIVAAAQRRMHAPAIQVAAVRPAPEAEVPQPATVEETFEEWRPRVIGRASSTIVDDMPAWGAVYTDEPEPEPTPVAADSTDNEPPRVAAAEPEPMPAAEPDAAPVSHAVEPIPSVAAAADAAPLVAEIETPAASSDGVVGPEALGPVAPDEAHEAPAEQAASVGADEAASDVPETATEVAAPIPANETVVAETPVEADDVAAESEARPERPVDDRVLSEQPAPETRSAGQEINGTRRFKSSLLADIDESGAEANAAFKSTILADLSGVRLPDDVPRFHSTTLVDPPALDGAEQKKANGVANRRR